MHKSLILIACLALCLGTAGAQVAKPGDLLVAGGAGSVASAVFAVTPFANTFTTIAIFPGAIRGVAVGADNTDYYVASGLDLFHTTPAGVVTTVVAALAPGVGTCWNDLDEDGQILTGTGWAGAGGLFRVDPATGLYVTLMSGIFPNAFALDRDSGDIIVGETTSAKLLRIKRDGTIVTVANALSTTYALDYHFLRGEAIIANNSILYRLDPLGGIHTFATGSGLVKSLAVLANGDVAAGPHGTTIRLYDLNGTAKGTIYSGASFNKMCMVVEDEHNLWGLNAPWIGGVFNLSIRFAGQPGKAYAVAAALSNRPGIRIGGKVIPVNPDNLFFLSQVSPVIFNRFLGVLDNHGRSSAYIVLPKVLAIRGIRVFLAAVVIDPAAPGGIAEVSQPYGATIQ
ncbi:MAG: hypothetical protein JXQ29_11475 [Planctomycetes bacterium]|nr:hypothetical protein [Planctomycetota bacterium]